MGIPYEIFSFVFNIFYKNDLGKSPFGKLHLGKLSIVKDVAGKSRVVGITNYWIQVSLKPLHDSILELLKKVPTDGTFGQEEVINRLSQTSKAKFSSFDLSAATDRLPIEVQRDILSLFIGRGMAYLWSQILNIPFFYGKEYVKYSVGQPMGAYSSWAMLALTHHVIVCSLFEKDENMEYAVLGDDMAITESKGDRYVQIMTQLGVKISLAKSIVSSRYVEFAKKLFNMVTGEVDACIGPKLVLASIHCKLLKVTILHDSYKRRILDKSGLLEKLNWGPSSKEGAFSFGHYLLFGPWGLVEKDRGVALSSGIIKHQFYHDLSARQIFFSMYEALSQVLLKRWRNNRYVGFVTLSSFFSNYCYSKVVNGRPALPLFDAYLMFVFSPGCWVPFSTYCKDYLAPTPLSGMKGDNLEEILEKLDLTPISSLSKPSKKDCSDMRAFLRAVSKEFDKAAEFQLECPW
jgi:hypothetical protein